MSEGPPEDGDEKKKPRHLRSVKPQDKIISAKPSAETVKQLYMASTFIEWAPFAASLGWNEATTRREYPAAEWIADKRSVMARVQAENVAEAVFQHRGRWHSDVLKTLREYPEANDALMNILKKRMNDIIGVINDDEKNRVLYVQQGLEFRPQFPKIKSAELHSLASAIKTVTESKHRALLIDNWSFKQADDYSDPNQFNEMDKEMERQEWKMEVIGGEKMNNKDLGNLISKWYDKPNNPHEHLSTTVKPDAED